MTSTYLSKSDEELIESYKRGDDASFQTLMRRSLKPVFNFVYQYVRNTEEAEDVTQDTFFKAWKNIKKFKGDKKWKPWLFTIARNTALDYIKKRKSTPFSELNSNEEESIPFSETLEDSEPLADELFEQVQNVEELMATMDTLKPEYHSILMLHYHQELTFKEIATVMNKPMNTVKSWHRRALENVKETLTLKRAPK
jgi:RNA polymerase sigma-70 factor (ECF subfamily)